MRIAFFLLLVFLIVPPVLAQGGTAVVAQPQNHLNGKDLMHFCKGQYDVDFGYCVGYITAVSEIMLDQPIYGRSACNQGLVAGQQLKELVQEYMATDPSSQLQPAGVTTAQALSRAFQCR
jgi:hypothetical protein